MLRSHLANPRTEEDPAWYALNAVYASGCRLYLAGRASLGEAHRQAWGLFENALACHTELLYYRSTFLALQALTVMVRKLTRLDATLFSSTLINV